jgi:predicted metal-dependent phosphoesterase TrpH
MEPRLRSFRADLHVHTALSPCAAEEMTPPAIVGIALARGVDVIAVCDHNSAGNVEAVQQAALAAQAARPGEDGLTVLPGMEITSLEEVHVLGLFPDVPAAKRVSARLRELLPTADPEYYAFFGEQPLLAADGRWLGIESAALAAATPLDLTETVDLIHSAGGLAIAAHVDRKAFGVLSQLGFFPMDAGFDAVEVSRQLGSGSPRLEEFAARGLPVTGSSDGHFLEDIGTGITDLRLAEPTFAELVLAFAGADGRSVARA